MIPVLVFTNVKPNKQAMFIFDQVKYVESEEKEGSFLNFDE